MKLRTPLLSVPLFLAAAHSPAAGQDARDFQLPPAPTPTGNPDVQGPVDTEGPVPVAPRPIETATPSPTPMPAPTGTATDGPQPTIQPAPLPQFLPDEPSPTRGPAQVRPAQPGPVGTAAPAPSLPAAEATPGFSTDIVPPDRTGAPFPPPVPDNAQGDPDFAVPIEPDESSLPWLPIAGGILALLAGLGGLLWWRRRQTQVEPPEIEPPLERADRASTAADTLSVRAEVLRLSRSLMFASLQYRVTVLNRSGMALTGLTVEADLASARADRPVDDQVAGPGKALPVQHEVQRLAPGQSTRFEGEVKLALSQAGVIRQGRASLLVPLFRVRALATGASPVAKTFVVGQTGLGNRTGRLQPFNLDEGPRSWQPITQKALD